MKAPTTNTKLAKGESERHINSESRPSILLTLAYIHANNHATVVTRYKKLYKR